MKGIDNLFGRLDSLSITYKGIHATEELSHGATIINSRGIRMDTICSHIFRPLRNVEERGMAFEVFLKIVLVSTDVGVSGGNLVGVFDGIFRLISKMWAKSLPNNVSR